MQINIEQFGPQELDVLRKEIQSSLDEIKSRHGLPQDFIGSEFFLDGSVFTITQLVTSRPKYPITAHCEEDGRTFKFTTQRIKELLETARVINIPYKDEEPN